MTARRRRGGSESEQVPLIVSTGEWGAPSIVNYDGPEHTDRQNRLGFGTSVGWNVVGGGFELSRLIELTTDKSEFNKMTSRDRTLEFNKAIQSLASRQVVRAVAARDSRRARHIQSYGEFMVIARTIGKNITSTYTKLEKLTLLAKRKSLFNDRPAEIQELTYIIKEDLNSLNQQIARLQEVSKTQKETLSASGNSRQHLLSHSCSVVLALQSKLANISNEFKQVLEVRTENLKQAKSRREHFSQGGVSPSLPPSAMSGHHHGSVLMADEQVSIDLSNHDPRQPLLQSEALIYDETDQYLSSRAETMQNIESTIVELGGIFQQLATMVKEQEEMVDRIDANVADAELNVEAAHNEILKYFQSVTNNRWLMIKVFAVLIFFFIFFVVFLA